MQKKQAIFSLALLASVPCVSINTFAHEADQVHLDAEETTVYPKALCCLIRKNQIKIKQFLSSRLASDATVSSQEFDTEITTAVADFLKAILVDQVEIVRLLELISGLEDTFITRTIADIDESSEVDAINTIIKNQVQSIKVLMHRIVGQTACCNEENTVVHDALTGLYTILKHQAEIIALAEQISLLEAQN